MHAINQDMDIEFSEVLVKFYIQAEQGRAARYPRGILDLCLSGRWRMCHKEQRPPPDGTGRYME